MANASFFNRTAGKFGNEFFANGTTDHVVDAASKAIAGGFKPTQSKTVSHIEVLIRGGGGTPPTFTVELQSDNAGSPSGTVLGSGTFTPAVTANTEYEIDIGDVAVTAGTNYWIVFYAALATGTNKSTYRSVQDVTAGAFVGHGMYAQTSTDTRATWSPVTSSMMEVGVKYDDGSFEGMGYGDSDTLDINDSSDRWGEHFPGNNMTATDISMFVKKSDAGTPSALLSIVLYNYTTSTIIESGTLVLAATVTTAMVKYTYTFATPRLLATGTDYLVYLTTAATSGTRYQIIPPKTFNGANMNALTYDGLTSRRSNLTTQQSDKDAYFVFSATSATRIRDVIGGSGIVPFPR